MYLVELRKKEAQINRDLQDGIDTSKGNMKIAQIKQIHVRAFYADLVKKGMAASTIKYYHGLISPALELAVDSDIIRKNPAKDCKKGVGGTKRERTSMTIIEQERMMEFVKNSTRYSAYYPMLVFMLSTGLRVGEMFCFYQYPGNALCGECSQLYSEYAHLGTPDFIGTLQIFKKILALTY